VHTKKDLGPADTKQVKNVVTKDAKPAEPMAKLRKGNVDDSIHVVGGPTPENPLDMDLDCSGTKKNTPPGGSGAAQQPMAHLDPKIAKMLHLTKEEIDQAASDEMDELLESDESLSAEFKLEAKTIFEAALAQRVQLEVERLEEEYENKLVEAVECISEEVEAFMTYTSAQWLNENQLAVSNGVRTELLESFMQGLSNLFTEHYISVPEERVDVFETMCEKLNEMEDRLNDQISANIELSEELLTARRGNVLSEAARGLTEVQKDKLQMLAESLQYNDDEVFGQQLEIVKDRFLNESPDRSDMLVESINAAPAKPVYTDAMEIYIRALSS